MASGAGTGVTLVAVAKYVGLGPPWIDWLPFIVPVVSSMATVMAARLGAWAPDYMEWKLQHWNYWRLIRTAKKCKNDKDISPPRKEEFGKKIEILMLLILENQEKKPPPWWKHR